jgi:membrane associated rhomboid family serine protease
MYKNIPICSSIATILIVVFLLALTTILKIDVCGKDFSSNLMSNFIHTEPLHLISNLYGLYVLSRIEKKLGALKFITVVFAILLVNTVIETYLHHINNDIPCSIGFSAILYGLLSWEIVSGVKTIDQHLIFAIGSDIVTSRFNKKIALLNHFIGLVSGACIGLFLKYDLKEGES